jgi:hypothetical protein
MYMILKRLAFKKNAIIQFYESSKRIFRKDHYINLPKNQEDVERSDLT